MKLKSIRIRASYEFQTIEMEFETPEQPNKEVIAKMQQIALKKAVDQAEMAQQIKDAKKQQMNQKRDNYESKKYSQNKYIGGNR